MFTGIIEAIGSVTRVEPVPGGTRARISHPGIEGALGVGESVAVDGVCLTVVRSAPGWFEAEISPETRRRSTFAGLRPGRGVNLERPLAASGRLGGHFVQGHVDAVGAMRGARKAGGFVEMTFSYPASLRGLLVEKGSIAVNGVSLTIAAVKASSFTVALIPHTLKWTNLDGLRPGDAVNLEADVLAKYVRALAPGQGRQVRKA